MKLDLSHFKKVSANAKNTVLEHPRGHRITISHDSLDDGHKQQIHAMAFAEGGDVENSMESTQPEAASPFDSNFDAALQGNGQVDPSQQMSTPAPESSKSLADSIKGMTESSFNPAAGSSAPAAAPAAQAPLMNHQMQPSGPQADASQIQVPQASTAGVDTMIQGYRDEAKVAGDLGNNQAQTILNQQAKIDSIGQHALEARDHFANESNAIIKDYADGHIRPDAYLEDKSTVGKISTAIGLILGGIGGGLTHQENPALKFLNQQIDRNVQAQKENIANKGSLYNMLKSQYGDDMIATNMLKSIELDKTSMELQAQAAKSGGPMAKARAAQVIGQLQLTRDQLTGQMGQRAAVQQAVGDGRMDAAQAIPHLVPEKHQAAAFKELNDIKVVNSSINEVAGAMDSLAKEQTIGNRLLKNPLQSMRSIDALNLQIAGLARGLFGRVNKEELELLNKATIKPGDDAATIAKKSNSIKEIASKGLQNNSILKAYNIPVPQAKTKPTQR